MLHRSHPVFTPSDPPTCVIISGLVGRSSCIATLTRFCLISPLWSLSNSATGYMQGKEKSPFFFSVALIYYINVNIIITSLYSKKPRSYFNYTIVSNVGTTFLFQKMQWVHQTRWCLMHFAFQRGKEICNRVARIIYFIKVFQGNNHQVSTILQNETIQNSCVKRNKATSKLDKEHTDDVET